MMQCADGLLDTVLTPCTQALAWEEAARDSVLLCHWTTLVQFDRGRAMRRRSAS
jgi:hypothetical protein